MRRAVGGEREKEIATHAREICTLHAQQHAGAPRMPRAPTHVRYVPAGDRVLP